jgi:hypothetical protein
VKQPSNAAEEFQHKAILIATAVNSMLAVISGAAPHNGVEGILAAQMAASHQLARFSGHMSNGRSTFP